MLKRISRLQQPPKFGCPPGHSPHECLHSLQQQLRLHIPQLVGWGCTQCHHNPLKIELINRPMFITASAKSPTCAVHCRYFNGNQLTGALPAAWSSLTSLQYMWVPWHAACLSAGATMLHRLCMQQHVHAAQLPTGSCQLPAASCHAPRLFPLGGTVRQPTFKAVPGYASCLGQ